jgi:hypothetical protein
VITGKKKNETIEAAAELILQITGKKKKKKKKKSPLVYFPFLFSSLSISTDV